MCRMDQVHQRHAEKKDLAADSAPGPWAPGFSRIPWWSRECPAAALGLRRIVAAVQIHAIKSKTSESKGERADPKGM